MQMLYGQGALPAKDIRTTPEEWLKSITGQSDKLFAELSKNIPIAEAIGMGRIASAVGGMDKIKDVSLSRLESLAYEHGVSRAYIGLMLIFASPSIMQAIGGQDRLREISLGKAPKEEIAKLGSEAFSHYRSHSAALINLLGDAGRTMSVERLAGLVHESAYSGDRFAFIRFIAQDDLYGKMGSGDRAMFDSLLASLGCDRNSIPRLINSAHVMTSGQSLEEVLVERALARIAPDKNVRDQAFVDSIDEDISKDRLEEEIGLFTQFLGPRFSSNAVMALGLAHTYIRAADRINAAEPVKASMLRL
jgi:hypothetical protein